MTVFVCTTGEGSMLSCVMVFSFSTGEGNILLCGCFCRYHWLQSLVCLARNENHKKADEYAAALDEIRAKMDARDHLQLQLVFLRLLGDPVCAKVAREATTILKGIGKLLLPPLAMDPLRTDCLLTRLSKALSDFDVLCGGMLPVHAVITW